MEILKAVISRCYTELMHARFDVSALAMGDVCDEHRHLSLLRLTTQPVGIHNAG